MARPAAPQFPLARLLITTLTIGAIWFLLMPGFASLPEVASSTLQSIRARFYVAPVSAADTIKARAQFERDIRNNPTDPEVYKFIAWICMRSNRYDLASEYLGRSLFECKDAPRPERAELFYLLSTCYLRTRSAKPQLAAIFAAQRAAELDPQSPIYLNTYGYLLADNDLQLDEAVLQTSKALQLLKKLPDSPDVRGLTAITEDSYGWALYKQGHFDAASSALYQAIADLPTEEMAGSAESRETLGELYYHLGAACDKQHRVEAARQALQTALAYMPNNKEASAELESLKTSPLPAAPRESPSGAHQTGPAPAPRLKESAPNGVGKDGPLSGKSAAKPSNPPAQSDGKSGERGSSNLSDQERRL